MLISWEGLRLFRRAQTNSRSLASPQIMAMRVRLAFRARTSVIGKRTVQRDLPPSARSNPSARSDQLTRWLLDLSIAVLRPGRLRLHMVKLAHRLNNKHRTALAGHTRPRHDARPYATRKAAFLRERLEVYARQRIYGCGIPSGTDVCGRPWTSNPRSSNRGEWGSPAGVFLYVPQWRSGSLGPQSIRAIPVSRSVWSVAIHAVIRLENASDLDESRPTPADSR